MLDSGAGKSTLRAAAGTPTASRLAVTASTVCSTGSGQKSLGPANTRSVDVAQQGGAVLFNNVSFKEAAGYILLAGGTYNLEVREAGTTNVVLSVPNVALQSCNVYTIWAMGLVNGQPPLQAVTSTDATTSCATPAPGATVPPGGTAGAAKAITQAATVVTGTPRATGSPSASGTVTTGTPTKTTGTPTKATGTPGTKTATKAVTQKPTLGLTRIPVTRQPTPGQTIILKGTIPPIQPTSPPQQQPQQPLGGGGGQGQ